MKNKKAFYRGLKWGIGAGCLAVFLVGLYLKKEIQPEQFPETETGTAKQQEAAGQQSLREFQEGTGQELTGQQENTEQPVLREQQAYTLSEVQAMEAGAVLDAAMLNKEMTDRLFYGSDISEVVRQRIWNCSYQENNNIALEDLRYLRVLYVGFDGQTHIGELIVNQAVEEDILEIMEELYANSYPIEKMVLVDEYGAEDELSMADNNTSAFNYREIAGTDQLSMHGLGLAIDINPRYNPYVRTTKTGEALISPENGAEYVDRSADFPYKIDETDLCCQLFLEHGFTWGGNWNSSKDYQHFEKSLP